MSITELFFQLIGSRLRLPNLALSTQHCSLIPSGQLRERSAGDAKVAAVTGDDSTVTNSRRLHRLRGVSDFTDSRRCQRDGHTDAPNGKRFEAGGWSRAAIRRR